MVRLGAARRRAVRRRLAPDSARAQRNSRGMAGGAGRKTPKRLNQHHCRTSRTAPARHGEGTPAQVMQHPSSHNRQAGAARI